MASHDRSLSKLSSWFSSSGSGVGSVSGVGGPMSSSHSVLSASTLSLNAGKSRAGSSSLVGSGSGNSKQKEPRPQRTLLVTTAIVQGIREAILVTDEDINTLKNSLDDLSLQSQQQQKAAERYLKRLDYYLSALEELQEAYNVQSRLREGVRAMGKAYIESLGPERDSALANVRSGFKECNEVMCSLEGQLEPLLGALHIQMKGLQGFARLCPGDVFEITLRHGSQKWRTKGKIGRDGSQTWDSPKFTFKVMIDELLFIRAIEIRSLGKQLLLGNKYCETLDLFCAQPQMMTVNLNASGSVKLNLIVTWDPLDGHMEDNMAAGGGQLSSSSPVHRTRSIHSSHASPLGTMSSIAHGSITALSMASYGSEGTTSPDHDSGQSSTLNSTGVASEFHDYVNQLHQQQQDQQDQSSGKNKKATKDRTSPPPTTVAVEPPTPDYSDPEEEEEEEEDDPEDAEGDLSKKNGAGAEDTLSKARSDATGNFLLVKRNDPSGGLSPVGAASGSWWQQKYYSSPTHTVDSGFEDNGNVKRHGHPMLSHVFTEEDELQEQNKDHLDTLQGNASSDNRRSFGTSSSATWLTPDFGRSAQDLSTTDEWDDDCLSLPNKAEGAEEPVEPVEPVVQEEEGGASCSTSSPCWTAIECDLDEALDYLTNVIADSQGQFSELELFERSVTSLHQLYKVQNEQAASQPSASNLTIDSVLECFDFLDNEESEASGSSSPAPPKASSPSAKRIVFTQQLDNTLLIHLKYCQHLITDLGSFGPLKCRERRALSRLQIQGRVLNKLAKLIEKWQYDPTIKLSIIEELNGLPHLQKLWGAICAGSRSLSVANEDAFNRLLPMCRSSLLYSPYEIQEKVLKQLLARCQDVEEYNPQLQLTVFQFRYFVRSKECSFQTRLDEINDELQIISALQSQNPQYIQKTMARLSLMGPIPSVNILLKMSHLVLDPSDHSNNPRVLVTSFLKNSVKDVDLKHKLIDSFVEGLESTEAKDRQGSCEVLAILQDSSVVSRLAYLGQSDPSSQVRKQAKISLHALGAEGRDALQQLQLSSHGFQGISVK